MQGHAHDFLFNSISIWEKWMPVEKQVFENVCRNNLKSDWNAAVRQPELPHGIQKRSPQQRLVHYLRFFKKSGILICVSL